MKSKIDQSVPLYKKKSIQVGIPSYKIRRRRARRPQIMTYIIMESEVNRQHAGSFFLAAFSERAVLSAGRTKKSGFLDVSHDRIDSRAQRVAHNSYGMPGADELS